MSHTADMAHYPRSTSFVQGVFAAAIRAGLVPVEMSYFEAREGKTIDYCRQRVRQAELYVAVIGFRIGSLVPGTTMSYTEAEFREAGAAGRRRLVFLLDEDAPIPTRYVDENRCDVEAFRQRLKDEAGIVATFTSADQLELKAHHSFIEYLKHATAAGPNGGSADRNHPDDADDSSYMDRVTQVSSFSLPRLAHFRTNMRPAMAEEIPEQLDAAEFLQYANLVQDGRLTNAGVLLFGEDPAALIPHAIVQCTTFSGETRISPLESRDLRGTVPELIERAREFVANACRLGEIPSSDSAYAEPTYDIPMIAVREVIANALIHRDYERTDSCVHIRVLSDRVEIVNPGTWGDQSTIQNGHYHLHDLRQEPSRRNFRLASVLRWSGLVEGEGTGVPRAVADSKRLGTAEPTVALANRRVMVTIHRQSYKQSPHRRRALYAMGAVGTAVVVAVLIAAVSLLGPPLLRSGACGGPFSSLTLTATGECVGVIDNDGVLDAKLRPVASKIRTENETVAATTEEYAKIVLLTPLSAPQTSASAMTVDEIKHSLEGAYTALHRINHTSYFGDPSAVKVQLLIANYGSRQEYSERLVGDILGRGDPKHPLVAVVGLGPGSTGTEKTARALADKGIPMVSAVASADNLNMQNFPGLRSVSPSNGNYVNALNRFIAHSGLRTGIIVQDQNEDLYIKSLRDAYNSILHRYLQPPLGFAGGTIDSPTNPGVFTPVVSNLCNAADSTGLDMIFYAGRSADFEAFARALSTRICQTKSLVVFAVLTGFRASSELMETMRNSKVTMVYASATDPEWNNDPAKGPEGFASFLEVAKQLKLNATSRRDGFTIMYHDAVVCAARALRLAVEAGGSPRPTNVMIQFTNLNRINAVGAASGTLAFDLGKDGRASGQSVIVLKIGYPAQLPDIAPLYTCRLPGADPLQERPC